MSFAGKVWRLLVGIKDALVLVFILLFFLTLFASLSTFPEPRSVKEGALFINLDGIVVEESTTFDPFEALNNPEGQISEYPVFELVHAFERAAKDEKIKAVALDLSGFMGGGHVHMQEIADALAKVRAADKPVLVYSLGYDDAGLMLAAHASEVWLDPLGGAMIFGPGGERLYYAGLIEKLDVNARVYRVGTYKSAVEPFTRSSMSPEARANAAALYGAIWEEWKGYIQKARPEIALDQMTEDPAGWIVDAGGDMAQAALDAGLADKLGTRTEFGERVAEIAGKDNQSEIPGSFASNDLETYLAENSPDTNGKTIGIVTVAGEIVDGNQGPGTAGGDRITDLLDEALEDDLAALVVRVDSPGGSVIASEAIRNAVLRHKAKGIPVAISMSNVAASGGYWIATAGERIFAEPETITGSIGAFAILPTFEQAAARWGVNTDGVRTTPLSGQPDFIGGFTPEVDTILQASVEDVYADFITRVAEARGLSRERIDEIGQGRVWDGGTARQLGLVDQFGGLAAALEWAAGEAGLEEGKWHARRLTSPVDPYDELLAEFLQTSVKAPRAQGDLVSHIARSQDRMSAQLLADLQRLTQTRGVQAYCLECPPTARAITPQSRAHWLERITTLLAH